MSRGKGVAWGMKLAGLAGLLLVLLGSMSGCPPPPPPGLLQVHFIDVGQGDSILVVAPDGATALIDGGNADSKAMSYLRSHGIQRLDLVIATHPHSDHIGGLAEVLRTIPVGKVVTNGTSHTSPTYEAFLDAIAAAQVPYNEVKRGDTIPFDGLTFDVLNPSLPLTGDLNNDSLVLRLVCGGSSPGFSGGCVT